MDTLFLLGRYAQPRPRGKGTTSAGVREAYHVEGSVGLSMGGLDLAVKGQVESRAEAPTLRRA